MCSRDRPEGGREDNDWEMTLMGATTKANAGLEDHELASVSGGLAPQVATEASHWKGLFQLDLQTVIWETRFRGPKHLAMQAGT